MNGIVCIQRASLFEQDVPQELVEKRPKVVEEFDRLQRQTKPLQDIFGDEEVSQQLQSTRDTQQLVDYLTQNHGRT